MNNIARISVVAFAGATIFISAVHAQQYDGPPSGGRDGEGHRHPKPAVDSVLDANGDQVISADEIAGASSVLTKLDADGDGRLSFSECMGFSPQEGGRQAPPAGRGEAGGQPPAPPVFSALDASGDQFIDEDEIDGASSALLELDKNGDGHLDPDECRPARRTRE